MSRDGFFLHRVEIHDSGVKGGLPDGSGRWNFETHYQDPEGFLGSICERMFGVRCEIGEVIGSHGLLFVFVFEDPSASKNEVDLFFAVEVNRLAIPVGIDLDLGETGDALEETRLGIAFAKNRPEMARP